MGAAQDQIRVLHVDDEPAVADLAATHLERHDDRFRVRTATSPEEGLEGLAEAEVDCVVSDYDMPDCNGIEFLEAVREESPDLPFILFTGKGSEEIASEAISAGVTDYLQKETGTEQYTLLANRIENAVAGRRAERAIERTREYFGTVLAHASDVVMILDEAGTLDYVSPSVERMLGFGADEMEGTDAFDWIHPDDLSLAERAYMIVLENPDQEHDVEFRMRHADGSWRWLEIRGRNLLDDPVVGGVVVNVRDVTERKASRHELETIIDNLPGCVYRHRYEEGWPLEFVKGAAESVTGYTAEELEEDIGLAEEIIHPDDREYVWTGVEEGLAETGYFDLNYRILTSEDGVRWIRDQGQLVEDPATGEEFLDGFVTDVTGRRERERNLKETSALLSTLSEFLPVGVLATGADGVVLAANDCLFDLFGLAGTPDEFRGDDSDELFDAIGDAVVDGSSFQRRVDEWAAAGDQVRGETVAVEDGRSVACRYDPVPYPDEEGDLFVFHDATAAESGE